MVQLDTQFGSSEEEPSMGNSMPLLILRRAKTVQLPMSKREAPSPVQLKTSLSAPPPSVHTLLETLHADSQLHAEHVPQACIESTSWLAVEKNTTLSGQIWLAGEKETSLPEQSLPIVQKNTTLTEHCQPSTDQRSEVGVTQQCLTVESIDGPIQENSDCFAMPYSHKTQAPYPTTWEVPLRSGACAEKLAQKDVHTEKSPLPQATKSPGGTSASSLKATDLCEPGLFVVAESDYTLVQWALPAKRLKRDDKQIVSPAFSLTLHGNIIAPFRVVLQAPETTSKKGGGFRKSMGYGCIGLKCESRLPETHSDIEFSIGVGGDQKQEFRGPVARNFFEHSFHGLDRDSCEWNLTETVDAHGNILVKLKVAPKRDQACAIAP